MGDVSILAQPVMTAREAAHQLRIPPSTLLYWLEGGRKAGKEYDPILRESRTGSTDMTWGEVVEARYLRAYRGRRVAMQKLRPFIRDMRHEFGVPYPLAHYRPFIGHGLRLLVEIQEHSNLPANLRAVFETTTRQYILDPRASDFIARVDFAEDGQREAVRLWPAGRESPVVMNPRISSAATTVRGIRTEVLTELHDAGEPIESIAEDFGISPETVRAAVSWEWSVAA